MIFLISCKSETEELHGTWMCSYVGQWENDSLKYESPCQKLIEFEDDKIHLKTFYNWHSETSDTILTHDYEFKGSTVYYNNDSLILTSITNDSLVIESPFQDEYSFVYKKVPEITSPEHVFKHNHLYEFKVPTWTDTMEFWSDSTMMFQNEEWARDGNLAMWYIAEYKNLKFLFIVGSYQSNFEPFLITESLDNGIEFKVFSQTIVEGSLLELPEIKPRTSYEGTWVEESTSDRMAFFYYLIKDSTFNYHDSISELTFTSDSLYISQFNITTEYSIESSYLKTHIRLHKPPELTDITSYQWHMTNPSDSTLKVYTHLAGSASFGTATVLFNRKNVR